MAIPNCNCNFEDSNHLATSCGTSPNITLFMALVDLLLRTNCRISDPCRRAPRFGIEDPEEYDFIVVGAGVGGSVVASRLSEEQDWSVLLLEAGPEEPTTTSVPAFAFSAVGTHLDWQYKTTPQKDACLATGGVCDWPRGKMVAGSGAMTGMMYTRGHRNLYDRWAKDGNTGWSYEECLPYFIKSENNQNLNIIDDGYHGTSGPMNIQQFPSRPKIIKNLLMGAKIMGYEEGDLNGKNQTGFAVAQVMVKEGLRLSTARAFLRPAMERSNLVVKIHSHAAKVVVDRWTKRATAVQYIDKQGETRIAKARKEIILSAGAIGSPQILLLSGIGPRRDLKRLGIPTIQDLPVGRNLHNHVSVGINFFLNNNDKRMLTMDAVNHFLESRTGPLSSTGLTQFTAFLQSSYAKDDIPDIQLFFDGFLASCSSTGKYGECSDGRIRSNCGRRVVGVRPTNLLALSRGTLKLKTTDPKEYPLLNPNYLEEKRDIDVLVEAIKKIIQLTETEPLQKLGFELDKSPVQGCENVTFGSDEFWECLIRTHTGAENHQGGTCKMGPVGDFTAVVDPELRVHGIVNLRIMDASIFPTVPNANPVGGIMMVAEKGSDMIKAAWKKR